MRWPERSLNTQSVASRGTGKPPATVAAICTTLEPESRTTPIPPRPGAVATPGESVIATAMAGLVIFSKTLAMEAKRDGIRVNVIAPGLIDTPMATRAAQDPAMPGPPDGGDQAFTDKGRFKCPCHGSIYNRYGQIIQGPAPRPMDRFPLKIDSTGKITVETGPSVAISRTIASASDAVPPTA